MDAFRLLKKDHRTVKGLFKKCESASMKARAKIFQQIAQELSLHTMVEEEIFYPRMRQEEKLKEMVGEAYEEHHVVKLLIAELSETSPDDERWEAKLTVLKEMVQHHVEEEESEMFVKGARALDDDESKQLGKQIETAKMEHMKSQRKTRRSGRPAAGERPALHA